MASELADLFLTASAKRMQLSAAEINRCIGNLSEEQLWHRGAPHENSIANLLLHLEGNIRQWILHGIAGQSDVRDRDSEFTLLPSHRAADAMQRFQETIAESCSVISSLPHDRLFQTINPQPTGIAGAMTITEAILRIVGHLQLHQGQIILLAKQLHGADLDLSIPRKR